MNSYGQIGLAEYRTTYCLLPALLRKHGPPHLSSRVAVAVRPEAAEPGAIGHRRAVCSLKAAYIAQFRG